MDDVPKYRYHPSFEEPDFAQESEIYRLKELVDKFPIHRMPDEDKNTIARLCSYPVLDKQDEQLLFRQMHFFRWKADNSHDDEFVRCCHLASIAKNILTMVNIRLLVNFIKKQRAKVRKLTEYISDGSLIIMRCIEYFRWEDGFKFSTYLTWALIRSLKEIQTSVIRNLPCDTHHDLTEVIEDRSGVDELRFREEVLEGLFNEARFSDHVIAHYVEIVKLYWLHDYTLVEIGQKIGTNRESVRQDKQKGMAFLRSMAKQKHPQEFSND